MKDYKLKLQKKIESFINLENDWDGYGAMPISRNVITDALLFLGNLPDCIHPPVVNPSADNEIVFYWRTEYGRSILSFFGDSKYHAYIRIGKSEHFYSDVECYEPIPAQVMDKLKLI